MARHAMIVFVSQTSRAWHPEFVLASLRDKVLRANAPQESNAKTDDRRRFSSPARQDALKSETAMLSLLSTTLETALGPAPDEGVLFKAS